MLQDVFNLLRPDLNRFTSSEEAYNAAAALEVQQSGGLEPIEEVMSNDEDGDNTSESEDNERGGHQTSAFAKSF